MGGKTNIEIPPFLIFSTNLKSVYNIGSLAGAATSKKVSGVYKGKLK